ncbi:hypothetical protein AB0D35_30645, partial [Streptomyces sp. NPDC048301]
PERFALEVALSSVADAPRRRPPPPWIRRHLPPQPDPTGVGQQLLRHESFAVGKLDHCLERLARPEFAAHIHTDRLTVPQVADIIGETAGLPLVPDTDSPLRHRLRRAWTGIRHIRFD